MKTALFWFGIMIGLILTLIFSDRQPASEGAAPDKSPGGDTQRDWQVSLHLTDLDEATACDYEDLLVTKFNAEIVEGGGFVTIQKGDCNGIT